TRRHVLLAVVGARTRPVQVDDHVHSEREAPFDGPIEAALVKAALGRVEPEHLVDAETNQVCAPGFDAREVLVRDVPAGAVPLERGPRDAFEDLGLTGLAIVDAVALGVVAAGRRGTGRARLRLGVR